MGKEDTRLQL